MVSSRSAKLVAAPKPGAVARRSFLQYAGAAAGLAAVGLAGCTKDAPDPITVTGTTSTTAYAFGAGDGGLLNYAYALEQLEAAFYAQVLLTPATDFAATELAYFTQIAQHEAIHRDLLKAVINRDFAAQLLPVLTFSFGALDFTKRATVLAAAQQFEDLGVSAYNGAAHFFRNATYLGLAGQISSVEARHAAAVRDLLASGTFGDTADANALDQANPPAVVLAAAQPFIKNPLDGTALGT